MASVQIVAEIGTNWEPGNLESALEMVRVAKACGADVVKFQDFRVDSMDRPQWWKDKCRPWEIPIDWWIKLRDESAEADVRLLSSVWNKQSISRAWNERNVALKVAASEIGNQRLLRQINEIGDTWWLRETMEEEPVPVYLSVDYRKLGAVVPALTWLPDCAVTLLYCVSEYPAELPPADLFEDLKDYGLPVGWSSHLTFPTSITAAEYFVKNGATVVELHLRTESTPPNSPDNGSWSLYPTEFKDVVEVIRAA